MRFFYVVALFTILLSPHLGKAQGNLLIVPRRIVFEGTKRTQELNLANTGTDTARFIISALQYRMEKDGNFTEITVPDSGQNFADKFIRFYPRTVLLGPNEAQVIRVQLINTSQMQPGEYRSHLYFRAAPKMDTPDKAKADSTANAGGISIRLIPMFGISIPVIIRNGVSTTVTTLTDAAIKTEDGKPFLHLKINRKGNMSDYGDIKINYVSANGSSSQIGIVKGLSVYTPNAYRTIDIKLEPKSSMNLRNGKLQIVYAAQSDSKPVKFAETELLLK